MNLVDWQSIDEATRRIVSGARLLTAALPGVIADPRAYPREAMLLAAIAALVALLFVLFVMSVNDAVRDRATRRNVSVRRRTSSTAWRSAAVASFGIVVVAGIATLPMLPSSGQACGACHSVREAVTAWQRDAHASTSCFGCHAEPGLSGALSASLRGAGSRITKTVPASVSVSNRSCLSCHDGLSDRVVGSTVRVRHRDIIEAGTGCQVCHPAVGHASLERAATSFTRSVMSRCLVCHDGAVASADCDTCHVGGPLDTADSPRSASTMARGTCTDCHSQATSAKCIACHGLELPHPVAFMKRHAAMSADDPNLCAKCHEAASATDTCACHFSDANQHGTYAQWFPIHGARARSTGPGGCLCHDDNGFRKCAACHDSYPWGP